MTMYAYLRVSTKTQTVENQQIKIENAGFKIDRWIEEEGVSGAIRALERPEFSALIKRVVKGDTVIAVSLDRLGRDTEDVLHTIRNFHEKGVHLRVMDLDGVDMTSQTGKIIVTVLSMVAEMERNAGIARSRAGQEKARKQGRVFGRYFKITPDVFESVLVDKENGASYTQLSETYGIDRNTLCRTVKEWGDKVEEYRETYKKQMEQKAEKELKAKK